MRTILLCSLKVLLVLNLVVVCTSLISCQQKKDTSPEVTGPVVDSVASSDGVMIYYEFVGNGDVTLVFVHGWSCDRNYWRDQIDEFDETYQVVTIDLGGHGQSGLGREEWTIEAFGADIAAVVNDLNSERVVMMGHSFAGSVIIQAATHFPEKVIGLVGVDTYENLEMKFTPEQITEATAAFRADFVPTVDGFVRGMFGKDADSELVDWVASDMSSAPPSIAVNVIENYLRINPVNLLESLDIPIYAISNENPPTNVEGNKKYASFELKRMSGVGHFVQMEDPATFNRLLHETLDELIGNTGDKK